MKLSCIKPGFAILPAILLCISSAWCVSIEPSEKSDADVDAKVSAETTEKRYELRHRFSTQFGNGPSESQLGSDHESFVGIRYEPTWIMYLPGREWSAWQIYGRAWINYNSQATEITFSDTESSSVQGWSSELRELYVRRTLLDIDPRISVSLGRQRYSDRYGIWWDDSVDSLKIEFNDAFTRAFLSVGEQLYRYNTDENKLPPQEDSIAYVFGLFSRQWASGHWLGVRTMYENDHSEPDEALDQVDRNRKRLGIYFEGKVNDSSMSGYDYYIETAALEGRAESSTSDENADESGWVAIGEFGRTFELLEMKSRLATRFGMTGASDSEKSGFILNNIQSDRVTGYSYSTGLLGSFIKVNLNNLRFYGFMIENAVNERHRLDFRVFDLHLEEPVTDLGPAFSAKTFDQENTHLGQVVDITYSWNMFPFAVSGKQIFVTSTVNFGYFHANDAITDPADDFQALASIDLRF